MAFVFARGSCVVAWTGGQTVLTEGQVWDADAELVQARPDLFTDEPPKVHGRRDAAPQVETATRAPGQQRIRQRPRKGS
ncbi:hypothetical protein [Streptomyces halstedii]|uniref:hypothetical protein n=1 Tax=Streptomyces halstedii TaxID=1944 RepID=UPI0033522CCC